MLLPIHVIIDGGGAEGIQIRDAIGGETCQMRQKQQQCRPDPEQPEHSREKITTYLLMRRPETIETFGITKEQMPVSADTITTVGLTIPASTAAEPMIMPPTMPMVELTGMAGESRPHAEAQRRFP